MWPSIPNPENSNAVQKIEIAYELVSKKQYNDETILFDILLSWKRTYKKKSIQKLLRQYHSTVMALNGNTMVYMVCQGTSENVVLP